MLIDAGHKYAKKGIDFSLSLLFYLFQNVKNLESISILKLTKKLES